MQDWVNLIVNNGIAIGMVVYFCYMNTKYNQTILQSLTVIEEMIKEFKDKE